MKKPTIHKKLSFNEILKRHEQNPQDKELHKIIESEGNEQDKEKFETMVKKAVMPSKP